MQLLFEGSYKGFGVFKAQLGTDVRNGFCCVDEHLLRPPYPHGAFPLVEALPVLDLMSREQ